jgi:adenosine deaminase
MTIKKVELHTHLEGTATPALVKKLADRNKLSLRDDLISEDGKYFLWHDFLSFLASYEEASKVIQTPRDYYDITFDYLRQCAGEDVIYVEMMYSPEHAERASGIPSREHVTAIEQAIDDAKDKHQIVGRIITTAVRHYGVEASEKVAMLAEKEPSKYIVGFGLGGDEAGFPPELFKRTYEIAKSAGLGLTAHAGEWAGPDCIRKALDTLHLTRLGHGVRAIEDDALIERIEKENIHLELCPSSNISLGLFDALESHPFKKLYEKGLSVSLNSDDPPYFKCSVGGEYDIAKSIFGLNDIALKKISLMALDAAFCDDKTKKELKDTLLSD